MNNHKIVFISIVFFFFFLSCQENPKEPTELELAAIPDTTIYTAFSELPNQYQNFHSPKAINKIAKIENEYFRNYETGISPYYGTVWREQLERDVKADGKNRYQLFKDQLGNKGDSMHCTIYAIEALKAGFGENFETLEASHKRIWKSREHAGWSMGYLLVKEWGWKAYLIMDRNSKEFDHCLKAYQRKKEYPVWRQPNIPLEAMYIRGEDDSLIQDILLKNEFGWGFSEQGIHTWITRFDDLKECNWWGAPGKEYELYQKPLFLKTPFLAFSDYASHVVIFPPKALD